MSLPLYIGHVPLGVPKLKSVSRVTEIAKPARALKSVKCIRIVMNIRAVRVIKTIKYCSITLRCSCSGLKVRIASNLRRATPNF